MRGAEEDRLLLEHRTSLAVFKHALDNVAGLFGFVADGDKLWARCPTPFGPQVLREALAREADHAVGSGKDGLGRAVVALQSDDLGWRAELDRQIEDVADRRGTERINRLRVVANDGQASPVRLERQDDRGLQPVRILVFVDEHVVEAAADVIGENRIDHHLGPVEQQIVVIEHVLPLLGVDVAAE
jgi:hypothetical protein